MFTIEVHFDKSGRAEGGALLRRFDAPLSRWERVSMGLETKVGI